jgi:hypothetical protein
MNAPTPDDSANLFGRFTTDGRTKTHEVITIAPLYLSTPKRIAKKVKVLVLVFTLSPIILTVNYLRLLRMKLQPTLR